MKIVILTPRFPFPENGGDVLRINNIARYLKSQGHQLVLVSFYVSEPDMIKAKQIYDSIYLVKHKKIESILYSLIFLLKGMPIQCGFYYSPRYQNIIKEVIKQERPERCIAHLLRMVPYLSKLGVNDISTVEMTDALSKTYSLAKKEKGFNIKKIVYQIEQKLIANYEKNIAMNFSKTVLVSQEDKNYLQQKCIGLNSLFVYSNGVDMYPIQSLYKDNKICFIGNMRTLQNQNAAKFFAKEVFPLIKAKRIDAQFYIVGAQPSHDITRLGKENKDIVVTGYVDDLYGMIANSCVAVAPVHIAAGIQNKVLVAMAMGIPVILTELISKAIPELKNGENCFIADSAQDIANKCIEIMNNEKLRNDIGHSGYKVVKEHYSWQKKLSGYL